MGLGLQISLTKGLGSELALRGKKVEIGLKIRSNLGRIWDQGIWVKILVEQPRLSQIRFLTLPSYPLQITQTPTLYVEQACRTTCLFETSPVERAKAKVNFVSSPHL